ncbi:SCP-like protein, partial [Ostertagia ostertagi]
GRRHGPNRVLQKIFIILCTLKNVSSQRCPGNSNMTDELRDSFLNRHNTLRSSLAQGLQQNDNLGLAPPATNMEKMEYVCDVESSAMRSAQTCSGGISQESTRPGLKENTFRETDMSLDLGNVAETAMTTWWSQLSRNGVDEPNMEFTTELRFRTNSIISFSKAMTTWWSQLSRNGVDEPNMEFTTELRFRTNSIISFSKVCSTHSVQIIAPRSES